MRTLDPAAHARVRGRILVAAREVFASKGYHAASMNEVARKAGLAKAALYHYFKGKGELLRALHREVLGDVEERLRNAPRFTKLRDALFFLGRGYLEHFKQPGPVDMMRIALNVNAEDPEFLRLSSNVSMPSMEVLLDEFLGPCMPKGTPAGRRRTHLQLFFGALFYYRFVLRRICAAGHLPGEAEYLNHLVGVFSTVPRRQKKRSPF